MSQGYFIGGVRVLWKIAKALHINSLIYHLAAPFSHKALSISYDNANEILSAYSPCPAGSSLAVNKISKEPAFDLQIIVPAYNSETTISSAIDSILSQKTKFSFRVVLIDDGSSDSTPAIIDSYSSDKRVTVIHQNNKGFSGARNTGLSHIDAKYLAFVDSDDMLTDGAIEALMSVATSSDADIVEGGAYSLKGKVKYTLYKNNFSKNADAISSLHGFAWGKVYRSSLFSDIKFPEGYWFEDSINSFLIYPRAEKTILIEDLVYIYRSNQSGITRTAQQKAKCIDTIWLTRTLLNERKQLSIEFNQASFNKMLNQVLLNQMRISQTPENVQEAAFCFTSELIEKFYTSFDNHKLKALIDSLKNKDYGIFKLYCKLFS